MSAIYVHIPFCKRRCSYCDFITYANIDAMLPDYLSALKTEISGFMTDDTPAETLYFGGGTPSMLNIEQVADVIEAVRARFGIADDAEMTLEANPGTVGEAYYAQLRALGINRLSLGVQSFDDKDLRVLGRIHNANEAMVSFRQAREQGFENISLDLIFGLPGQTMNDWKANLAKLSELIPAHLSIYSLILEPGTLMTRWVERGLVALPEDDLVADMYEETMDSLTTLGYEHYEISSWALGEKNESRHNKVYWQAKDYLGFGAGAVGSMGGLRWQNTANVKEYILILSQIARRHKDRAQILDENNVEQRVCQTRELSMAVIESEKLSQQDQMNEMMMLGLRMTREGVSEKAFNDRFGQEMVSVFGKEIDQLLSFGLIKWVDSNDGRLLRLTRKGILLGNQVFKAFV